MLTRVLTTSDDARSPQQERVRWRERSRVVRAGRLWATRDPQTFNEKVRYKMLRDHRPLLRTFADKAAVRGYVADVVGERYLPRLHLLLDDPDELATAALPTSCVVKPTHGSGAVVAISPTAPADARLPGPGSPWVCTHVRPEHVDPEALAALARSWVSRFHGHGPNHEWAYVGLPRRIIVEELLTGADGGLPDDHKLLVFHGRCHYVVVDHDRFGARSQAHLTPGWELVPFTNGHPLVHPQRPEHLEEMVEVAERLGRDTDFVRVDLYDLPGRVVLGELTSYPAGGRSVFDPPSYDAVLGSHWTVPRRYR